MKIAIIGGGAAGLMCGAALAQGGQRATIFDGNEKLGKKLFLTGKGRCNLTNACGGEEFLDNIVRGRKFMMSALSTFSSADCMAFFEGCGLKLKQERGKRVFPHSDKSSDVVKALERANRGNEIRLNCHVDRLSQKGGAFLVESNRGKEEFDIVVIATGGLSYSATGSTGDGLKFAKKLGHNLIETRPALVAIELADKFISEVQGLSLKNVTLNCHYLDDKGKSQKKSLFGECMFTDKGLTGPTALSLSSFVNRAQKVQKLWLDLKPALSEQQLDARLLRDFDGNKNKNISNVLEGLLPKNLVKPYLQKVDLSPDVKVHDITKAQRERLVQTLKNFDLTFKKLYPLESGIITSGGVDTKDIVPKSCQSKICKNLYFIGEVLDVDCLTGGFNLQIAFSTAYVCAQDILSKLN